MSEDGMNKKKLGLSSEEIAAMTIKDRVDYFEKIYIKHPDADEIFTKLNECVQSGKSRRREPDCLLLTGDTGTGKSRLIEKFMAGYPREDLEERTNIPVLWLRTPPGVMQGGLVTELIYGVNGITIPNSRSRIYQNTILFRKYIQDCDIWLIVIDEFQHFYDQVKRKLLPEVADWIKVLIDNAKVSIAFVGMPDAEMVINANPQLKGRISLRHHITPFGYTTTETLKTFIKILAVLQQQLPLIEKERCKLFSLDMAIRIGYATNGVMRQIMRLLRKATIAAVEGGEEYISMDVLSETFTKYLHGSFPGKVNPFELKEFDVEKAIHLNAQGAKNGKTIPDGTNNRRNGRQTSKEKVSDIL